MKKMAVPERFGSKDLPTLVVYLKERPGQYNSGSTDKYEHFEAEVLTWRDGHPRGLDDRQPLEGFRIHAQMDNGNRDQYEEPRRFYGAEVEFSVSGHLRLQSEEAKRVARTFATLERRLGGSLRQQYDESLSEFVVRFFETVGADMFVVGATGEHGTYSSGTWQTLTKSEAMFWVEEAQRDAAARMDAVQRPPF